MIVVFFPLTLPVGAVGLSSMAPGLVWIAALLALLLSAERLFQADYNDGILEQWVVSGKPLSLRVLAKELAHGVFNLVPMLLFCPLLALLFALPTSTTLGLMLSLLCGTPAVMALCGLAAALGLGLSHKGLVMALLLLPLTLPVLILGAGSVAPEVHGAWALLLALSLLACAFLPLATAAVVRISVAD